MAELTQNGCSAWQDVISYRIVDYLPANELVFLREVDKATASKLSKFKTIKLSEPSPPHAFRQRWGNPDAFSAFSDSQRLNFLKLTAASGSQMNLQVALENAGQVASAALLEAAAAAGQLEICKLLRDHYGCMWRDWRLAIPMSAAARNGHQHVFEWLLAAGCPLRLGDVCSAARWGQEDLLSYALKQLHQQYLQSDHDFQELLSSAAEGLGLESFQRLYQQVLEDQAQPPALCEIQKGNILAAAAASPTPDWRAKVEWLEAQGYPRSEKAIITAARASGPARAGGPHDIVGRLQWLCNRGYTATSAAATAAVAYGNLDALIYLFEEKGVRPGFIHHWIPMPDLAVTKYMHAKGLPINGIHLASDAARKGCLPVVVWAVEVLHITPDASNHGLLGRAVGSGNLELVAWLVARGWGVNCLGHCGWDYAVNGGNLQLMDWLVERGYSTSPCTQLPSPLIDEDPYVSAAHYGDLAVLKHLHKLGYPLAPDVLLRAAEAGAHVQALRTLIQLGCPLYDWDELLEAVKKDVDGKVAIKWYDSNIVADVLKSLELLKQEQTAPQQQQ